MILSLVAAVSRNNVIGKGGTLPWHLPDDLRHFREKTKGKTVIMGRKTYESIGRPLPGRRNIVVSRQPGLKIEGCTVAGSLDDALSAEQFATSDEEVCVIGGGEIYTQALPMANRIFLTRVHVDIDGDAFFPEVDWGEWEERERKEHPADERHAYPFSFLLYVRKDRENDV